MARQHRRIGLISDLHGNAPALRAVLNAAQERGVDELVCLGDVATLGVAPSEVVDRLRELGCPCILGNHDDYLLDPTLIHRYTRDPLLLEAIDWCRARLDAGQLDFLRGFEAGLTLPLGAGRELRLFHGSPSSHMVDLLAETPADVFDRQLGSERAAVMAGGHTHVQMLRQHRGTLVVNPGSVGAPFAEPIHAGPPRILPHAEWATVEVRGEEISVGLHRVPVDAGDALREILASDHPMREEFAAVYR